MMASRPRRGMLCAGLLVVATCLPATAQDLSGTEVRGTALSDEWQDGQGVVTRGPDGKVIFLYGEIQPSVVCAPLQVCDIELQPGEIVRDVLVGDTVRWKVEPATSGGPNAQVMHLIVKPSEAGLQTSMVITTSRRTYHIELKSHYSQYMARTGFDYPEDIDARFAEINARIEASIVPRGRCAGRSAKLCLQCLWLGALEADADLQRWPEDLHPISVGHVRSRCTSAVRRLGRREPHRQLSPERRDDGCRLLHRPSHPRLGRR